MSVPITVQSRFGGGFWLIFKRSHVLYKFIQKEKKHTNMLNATFVLYTKAALHAVYMQLCTGLTDLIFKLYDNAICSVYDTLCHCVPV